MEGPLSKPTGLFLPSDWMLLYFTDTFSGVQAFVLFLSFTVFFFPTFRPTFFEAIAGKFSFTMRLRDCA